MDDEKFKSLIKTKCNLCFRKDAKVDSCLLFKEKLIGIENCIGPFKSQEDRMKKIRKELAAEKRKAFDGRRYTSQQQLDLYGYNRALFKILSLLDGTDDEDK